MLKIEYLLLFVIFALLINCGPRPGSAVNSNIAPTIPQQQSPPPTPMPDGAAIFAENCATCHGDRGEGAKKGIPLTNGHALHHSTEEYIEQVNDGTGKKMPAFKDKLTPEEITAVITHVRHDLQGNK